MPGRHMRIFAGPCDLFNRHPTSHPRPPNRSRIDTRVATLSMSHALERSTGPVLQIRLESTSRRTNHHVTEQLHSSHKHPQEEVRPNICLQLLLRDHRGPRRLRKRSQIAHTLHNSPPPCLLRSSRPSRSHRRVISEHCPRLHSLATMMIFNSARQHNPWLECKGDDD
jgi:hypothetical protein